MINVKMRASLDFPGYQLWEFPDGRRFLSEPGVEAVYKNGEVPIWTFPGRHSVNECSHCGRFDTEPNQTTSLDEAIEKKWLVEESAFRAAHV